MCFHPQNAWLQDVVKDGVKKRAVFFAPPTGEAQPIQLPCGKCLGCRMDKARTWAIRCLHESEMHEDNCFLTLTLSDENLHDLDKRDLQLFFKRLRKALNGRRVSYYAVGEYGSLTARPHYHALVFGWFPSDAYYWSGNGQTALFRSSFLERLWPFGNSLVGSVSYESACYVSRYCAKVLGSGGFALMSRNPAIGRDWYRKYGSEVSAHDGCHIPSTDCFVRPPRYYDGLSDPDDIAERKARRLAYSVKAHADETVQRLLDREECLRLRLERKSRIGEFDAFE